MNVFWFSCGVSSAIVSYLCKDEIDKIIYQHVDDQDEDSLRFLDDVQRLIKRPIEIHQSPFKSVENALRYKNAIRIIKQPAVCTQLLKQAERKRWEYENPGEHTYFWGLDCDEINRMDGFIHGMPKASHRFPLIERYLQKSDAHGIANRIKLRRPRMYDMGYHNNNCKGCVWGGKGYWNRIRVDFPDVFAARAKLEREIGHSCINGTFLDELNPKAGRDDAPIDVECGTFCYLNTL